MSRFRKWWAYSNRSSTEKRKARRTMANIFEKLNAVNVNDKTEEKNGLTYLSWAWAWAEIKKVDPKAFYTIYENADGWFYHTDGKTAWVKTGVTVDGLEHIEYLPVMDFRNASISYDKVTSFDVNKAIQRSLTKAVARHGLGLYIYAGEDLPESSDEDLQKLKDTVIKTMEDFKLDPKKVYTRTKINNIDELPYERLSGMLKWLESLDENSRKELM
jgi:hypothetical protein